MSTQRQHIYDVKRILTRNNITDESRLSNRHLAFLWDQRRAKEIRDSFKRSPVIEPIWIQDQGIVIFTQVNKSEDNTVITNCDCKFSKAVLPQIVSIMDPMSNTSDLGMYSITSSCGTYKYDYMSPDKFPLLTKNSTLAKIGLYTKIGDAIFVTPAVHKCKVRLILQTPLDGFVLCDTNQVSGTLIVGTVYVVSAGNITHNGKKYFIGQTFTAVSNIFTGPGQVQFNLQKRPMTIDDPYPMSTTMSEVIKLKILTQDFAIEKQQIADTSEDATDDAIKHNPV